MGNAIGHIVKEIIEVIKKNYRKPKLWIWLCIIVFGFALLLPYIDSNFFYFSRIEKRISVLEQVMALDKSKINSNQVYVDEYQGILQEMAQQRERTLNSVMNQTSKLFSNVLNTGKDQGNRFIKFTTGAVWCLIITICIPFIKTFKKLSDKVIALVFMIILSAAFGWISSIIPIIITPMVNYVGVPTLQLVFFLVLINKSGKKDA